MPATISYGRSFQRTIDPTSTASAKEAVPLIFGLLGPKSVVDVGCGRASWLKAFIDNGVEDVLGVDGEYVDASTLHIPRELFKPSDLNARLDVARQFDLVLSLEVAEHLEPARSAGFVADLCRLGDTIVFSAAIPGQIGTGHINLRWQSDWAAMFEAEGYGVDLSLRALLWNVDAIAPYYRQNILLLRRGTATQPGSVIDVIHPNTYLHARDRLDGAGLRTWVNLFPDAFGRSLKLLRASGR